ncbi:hypothetical protein RHGRI_025747 [Rhododendron griersonianum]|uniref:Endonuclease/exonuclease/phosphatase domain-containing protein n=1 Tax=Rhododendron griersonianum TaxID=479676 RepID=A0AAV6IQA0_9ERIC|nr:hypothetical protein RHGRI_025747 [Rhododendron griersonianum]
METKNNRNTLDRIRQQLQFSNCCYVDPVGLAGGLALWWKDEVDIEVRFKNKNIIRCIISWPNVQERWLGAFIYAPPRRQERSQFWDSLKRLACENDYPWFCVGDFNEIGSIWEKQGGGECSRSRIELFQSVLSECALMDLEFKGPAYTWSNNQGVGFNIRERLDKALATVEWRELFPHAQVFHGLTIGSDHSPIIVNCCIPPKRVPYVFKFESMWCTSENCKDIISNAWAVNLRGSAMFQLVQKLKKCKGALRPWSKMEFGNNVEKIKALKEHLALMQLHPFSQEQFDQEKQLKEELEITMLREEMYLHQRSRINWLNFGDKNSAFFHATVIQRRQ